MKHAFEIHMSSVNCLLNTNFIPYLFFKWIDTEIFCLTNCRFICLNCLYIQYNNFCIYVVLNFSHGSYFIFVYSLKSLRVNMFLTLIGLKLTLWDYSMLLWLTNQINSLKEPRFCSIFFIILWNYIFFYLST